MMRFTNEQLEFRIGNVAFGGQPGRRRAVMIGSLFYPGHSIVEDRATGRCATGKTEDLLNRMQKASEETRTPAAVMVYAETERAMHSHVANVADLTSLPIFIDSPSAKVRVSGCMEARRLGLLDRIVYNSLNAGVTQEELEGISASGVSAAVLLAFNPQGIDVKGKIYLLENGGGILPEGLIDMARGAGITKPLLDVAVMAAEQNAGAALRALTLSKAKWGFPCGCALHNAVESFGPLAELKGDDRKIYRYVDVASAVMPMMAGADFVMFGPIEYARRVMHAAAFADELLAQAVADI